MKTDRLVSRGARGAGLAVIVLALLGARSALAQGAPPPPLDAPPPPPPGATPPSLVPTAPGAALPEAPPPPAGYVPVAPPAAPPPAPPEAAPEEPPRKEARPKARSAPEGGAPIEDAPELKRYSRGMMAIGIVMTSVGPLGAFGGGVLIGGNEDAGAPLLIAGVTTTLAGIVFTVVGAKKVPATGDQAASRPVLLVGPASVTLHWRF